MNERCTGAIRRAPVLGPSLSLKERDRRWAGLRRVMRNRGLDAIVVGSFQGRERLESYLIDDFLDAVVILPVEAEPTVLAFSTARVSRVFESERRGIEPWVRDFRIGFGGQRTAEILREKELPNSACWLGRLRSNSSG